MLPGSSMVPGGQMLPGSSIVPGGHTLPGSSIVPGGHTLPGSPVVSGGQIASGSSTVPGGLPLPGSSTVAGHPCVPGASGLPAVPAPGFPWAPPFPGMAMNGAGPCVWPLAPMTWTWPGAAAQMGPTSTPCGGAAGNPGSGGPSSSSSSASGQSNAGGESHGGREEPGSAQGPPQQPGRQGAASEGSSLAATSEIRLLLRRRARDFERPKSSIGSVRIEEFSGDRKRYIKWKRAIEAQEQLYRLEASELTMLVYLSTRGEARDVLDQVPLSDLTAAGGNVLLWRLLDESYGETGAEMFERAERELNGYRRLPGQSIATYLASMKRLKAQYVRVDPDSFISDKAWGQRLLQRASLSRKEKLDVYYSAGGTFNASAIEAALRHRCSATHEEERRIPATPASTTRSWSSTRSSAASSAGSTVKRAFGKGAGKFRKNGVHLVDGEEDECLEEDEMELPDLVEDFDEPLGIFEANNLRDENDVPEDETGGGSSLR